MYTRSSHTFLIRVCIHLKYGRYLRGFILKRLVSCTSITYYIINTHINTCIRAFYVQVNTSYKNIKISIIRFMFQKSKKKYALQLRELVSNWFSLLVLLVFHSLSIQRVANIIIATRISREVCNYECHTFFRVR